MTTPEALPESTVLTSRNPRRSGRTRWWIVWNLFGSTVINYVSRQTFSVLSRAIACNSA
jgi:ACS family hexuronate transporter-like MFS transporter